jgi:hypothetical protein
MSESAIWCQLARMLPRRFRSDCMKVSRRSTGRRQMDRLVHFSISTPNLMT